MGPALSSSKLGTSSSLVSLVKVPNSDASRGSELLSCLSIPWRIRCCATGRLMTITS
jgi:hypothetical protein